MSHLRGKCARILALLALIAGLLGAATPGLAAAPEPMTMSTAGMDCDHGDQHNRMPQHRLPASDCCMVSVCAMGLTLPAAPSVPVAPGSPQALAYDLRAMLQPAGIVTAPIPHPPKA